MISSFIPVPPWKAIEQVRGEWCCLSGAIIKYSHEWLVNMDTQFSHLGGWDQGASMVRLWWGPSLGSCSWQGRKRARELAGASFAVTLIPGMKDSLSWPSTSERSWLLTPSHWGEDFNIWNLKDPNSVSESITHWRIQARYHHSPGMSS
jgi:hypothetical protein